MNEKILRGQVPWTKKGFDSVNEMLHQLLQKPKDDWDLNVPAVAEYDIKPYEPIAQVYAYILKRYPETLLAKAHFLRYNNIIRFIQKYRMELSEVGFLTKMKGQDLLKDEVIDALSVLSFNGKDDLGQSFFKYDEVIDYTRQLIRKKESKKPKEK